MNKERRITMDARKMVEIAYKALDEKKGEDIQIIKVGDVSVIADYFLIVNGNSDPQVQALVNNVQEALAKEGVHPKQIEGVRNSSWILMDYGDVVIHVFSKEDRCFYDLERVWKDGKFLSIGEL